MDVSLSMTRQVLLALRFLHHDMHLVHGDLKPDNVLLKRNDEGKFIAKVMMAKHTQAWQLYELSPHLLISLPSSSIDHRELRMFPLVL